jgi:hypothetical protein
MLLRWSSGSYVWYSDSTKGDFAFTAGKLAWLFSRNAKSVPAPKGKSFVPAGNALIAVAPIDWADFTLPFTLSEGVSFAAIADSTMSDVHNGGNLTPSSFPIWTFDSLSFVPITTGNSIPLDAVCGVQKPYFVYNTSATDTLHLVIPPIEANLGKHRADYSSAKTYPTEWYVAIEIRGSNGTRISNLVIGNLGTGATGGNVVLPLPAGPSKSKVLAGLEPDEHGELHGQALADNPQWSGSSYMLELRNQSAAPEAVTVAIHHPVALPEGCLVEFRDHGRIVATGDDRGFSATIGPAKTRVYAVVAGTKDYLRNAARVRGTWLLSRVAAMHGGYSLDAGGPDCELSAEVFDPAGRCVAHTSRTDRFEWRSESNGLYLIRMAISDKGTGELHAMKTMLAPIVKALSK